MDELLNPLWEAVELPWRHYSISLSNCQQQKWEVETMFTHTLATFSTRTLLHKNQRFLIKVKSDQSLKKDGTVVEMYK